MLPMNRRTVLTTATAAAAFGLNGTLEIIPSAHAQTAASPLNPKAMSFHKFKVGDIEVTTVFDGAIFRDHAPGNIANASIDDMKASLRAAGLPDEKVPNCYTVTFVKIGTRTVMFDSGNGENGPPGSGVLAANMKLAGIDPASLSAIVITHFHPDHLYGLMTKENAQVYPNVEIVMPEIEYKFWADPAVIDKLAPGRQGIAKRVQASLPTWKNIKQVTGEIDVLPGIRAVPTFGHSPGHTSYLMGSGAAQFMVTSDVSNVPAVNLRNPGWHIGFDQDAARCSTASSPTKSCAPVTTGACRARAR
jgi:glyoxylase-like metal-dependent hydrolase (beta-lactamase superfamily II)